MKRILFEQTPPVGSLVTEADLRHMRWILGITSVDASSKSSEAPAKTSRVDSDETHIANRL